VADRQRPSEGEKGRRWVIVAAAVLLLLVTAVMVGKLLKGDLKDAEVWYDAGRRALSGESLVGLLHYRYPPAFAVMVSPLCLLPFSAFFLVWYAANVALFLASLRLAAALVCAPSGWRDLPRQWAPAAVVVVFAIDNLFLGQTNILVMALVYWAMREVERGREWWAGAPLAAAVATKVFPLPLLGYFAYRGRVRMVAGTVLWCAFLLLVLPAPLRGFGRNLEEMGEWGSRVVMPYLSRGEAGDWGQHALDFGNQSVQAVAHRLLTRVDAYVAARQRAAPVFVNVASLSEAEVNWLVLAAFGALGASFLAACGWRRPREPRRQAVEYSLAIILVLLVSALAWTYFFVMLLLPVAAALELLRRGEDLSAASRWGLRVGVAAVVASVPLLANWYARALGSVCWAALALYVGLALACRDLRRAEAEARGSPSL